MWTKSMRYAALAFYIVMNLLKPTAAHSEGLIINHAGRGHVSTMTIGPMSDTGIAKIIQVPEDLSVEHSDRVQQWEDSCHPRILRDRFGVRRYTYAHDRCEYGVEDE